MRLVLIADTFPPHRTSGAVMLRDLSYEFVRQGHAILVILPSPEQSAPWSLEDIEGVQVMRLRVPRTKDIGYVRRTLAEFVMPLAMLRQFRKTPLISDKWDGVVWYAPSIFLGPLASALKRRSNCKGYLIIRDIFPEWAVDMGLMGRGLPYRVFDAVARYQYSVADVIGVQTPGNRGYFGRWLQQPGRKLEVLQNWLGKPTRARCSIRVSESALVGRRVFVYAGNMGVAQGMDILLDLADKLRSRSDVGFLFVGRGSDAPRLRLVAEERQLDNVLFYDEIHPDEMSGLFAQCSAGIVALDCRHKSHNIPGKFLTYIQSGLPVLANINGGNDLGKLIRDHRVGQVCESNQVAELLTLLELLLDQIHSDLNLPARCKQLFDSKFSVDSAVAQITAALSEDDPVGR